MDRFQIGLDLDGSRLPVFLIEAHQRLAQELQEHCPEGLSAQEIIDASRR